MENNNLKASLNILITCHNRAKDVEKLINRFYTIICPKNVNFSIHIIDDASTDNSATIIEKLQKKYTTLFLYKNNFNKGLFWNRVFLLKKCNADFILFMDDDDYIDDNLLIQFSNNLNYDFIKTKRIFIYAEKKVIPDKKIYPIVNSKLDLITISSEYFITGNFISRSIYLKILEVLENIKINFQSLNIYEDMVFYYLSLNFAKNFCIINSWYYYNRKNCTMLSNTENNQKYSDVLRIYNILESIKNYLINTNQYNLAIDSIIFNLLFLMRLLVSNKDYNKIIDIRHNVSKLELDKKFKKMLKTTIKHWILFSNVLLNLYQLFLLKKH